MPLALCVYGVFSEVVETGSRRWTLTMTRHTTFQSSRMVEQNLSAAKDTILSLTSTGDKELYARPIICLEELFYRRTMPGRTRSSGILKASTIPTCMLDLKAN